MWQRQRLLLKKPTETINRNYQMTISDTAANQLIERYQLIPHPEGGWYRELHRSEHTVNRSDGEQRSALTLILFLLQGGDISRWHRVAAADETWHFIAGDALELFSLSPDGGPTIQQLLGFSLADAELKPVAVIRAGWWQAARSTGEWSLVSCCVGPGFCFSDFSLLASYPKNEHPPGVIERYI